MTWTDPLESRPGTGLLALLLWAVELSSVPVVPGILYHPLSLAVGRVWRHGVVLNHGLSECVLVQAGLEWLL